MATTIEATFDGQVFRPSAPVSLEPNTTVRLTVEPLPVKAESFLRTARSLKLDGPPDWASKLDDYLYGEGDGGAS
ncbi:MAG TPA: antitoxin family protein [Isosphaeraceae bacterium]